MNDDSICEITDLEKASRKANEPNFFFSANAICLSGETWHYYIKLIEVVESYPIVSLFAQAAACLLTEKYRTD